MKHNAEVQDENSGSMLRPPPRKFASVRTVKRTNYNPYLKSVGASNNNSRWSNFKKIFRNVSMCCRKIGTSFYSRNTLPSTITKDKGDRQLDQGDYQNIDLADDSGMPKLTNVDGNKLNQQINKSDGKDGKPHSTDLKDHESAVPTKSCLKKPNKTIGSRPDSSKNSNAGSNKDYVSNIEPHPNTAKQANYMDLVKSVPSYDTKSGNFSRKRKVEDSDKSDDKTGGMIKDLEKSVIPSSKQALKRRKIEESKENEVPVNMNRAKRRKHRMARKASGQNVSDDESESSDGTVTSGERDDLMSKYLKKLLNPIFEEQRELNKKDIQDVLNRYDTNKVKRQHVTAKKVRYNEEDPFLEDEGFAPSDNSGVSIPSYDEKAKFN
jgi:hypothetical protein